MTGLGGPQGTALDLPPPDIASKLGELFNRGTTNATGKGKPHRCVNPMHALLATTTPCLRNAPGRRSVTATACRTAARASEVAERDPDIQAYLVLPTHVLEAFLDFFRREEEKQIAALSRWYERKRTNVNRKIDALLLIPESELASPLKHPTLERPKVKAGRRRLPSRRSPSASSPPPPPPTATTAAIDDPTTSTTTTGAGGAAAAAVTRHPRKKKKPVPRPRRRSGVLDAEHPFHDDLGAGWFNPLADPSATLRGATVLSPSDVDLWIHRDTTRASAEDLLLEQDYPGSWLVRAASEGSREVVELMVDTGTGSPAAYPVNRTHTGALQLGTATASTVGTLRALMQVLCSESSTDSAADLPTLSFDQAVLRERVAAADFAAGVEKGWGAAAVTSVKGDSESDTDSVEEEEALDTSAAQWLSSVDPTYVHRECSEDDAALLLHHAGIGSWVLRVVLPEEAWGDAVEAEILANEDGAGGEPLAYRVSQCLSTGRLVVDGQVLETSATSLDALCEELGLDLGQAVSSDAFEDGAGASLEWDPIHEGLSLATAMQAVRANQLIGSWLIRVPGTNSGGADLVLHTGDGAPLCLPLIPTERQTLTFDRSAATTRVPEGEYDSFEDLIEKLTTATATTPAWLDLERAVPVWGIAQLVQPATEAMPTTLLYDILDGLLDS